MSRSFFFGAAGSGYGSIYAKSMANRISFCASAPDPNAMRRSLAFVGVAFRRALGQVPKTRLKA